MLAIEVIEEKVCNVLKETLDNKITIELVKTDGMASLPINSMKFLLLITSIENEFDIEFDDDEINFRMFGDFTSFCQLIQQRMEE